MVGFASHPSSSIAGPVGTNIPNLRVLRPLETVADVDEDTARFLVDGPITVPIGEVSVWYGDGGIGKSWLAYQLAVSIASGRDFLGGSVCAGRIVILDFENREPEVATRLRATARALGIPGRDIAESIHLCAFGATGETLFNVEDAVLADLQQLEPAIVIVDGWQGAFGGDSTKAEHVDSAHRVLRRLSAGTRAVLVLHHISSTQAGNVEPTIGGNRYVQHLARAVYLLRPLGNEAVKARAVKENYGISRAGVELRKITRDGGLTFEPSTEPATSKFRVYIGDEASSKKASPRSKVSPDDIVLEYLRECGGKCLESRLFLHGAERLGVTRRAASNRLKPAIRRAIDSEQIVAQPALFNTRELRLVRPLEGVPTASN